MLEQFSFQINRHGAEEARRAHNPEVTRSKRVAGIITIQLLCRSSTRLHMDTLNRHGAAAARGAHNSEVTRSKRVAGMIFFLYIHLPYENEIYNMLENYENTNIDINRMRRYLDKYMQKTLITIIILI